MPIQVSTAEKKAEIARDVVVAYLSHVKDEELADLGKVDEAITRLAEVVAPFARLEARVRRTEAEIHLELTFEAERAAAEATPSARGVTRGIKVNGLPTRATGLVGQLPVVYFSPADVELAGGPPAG